MLHHEQRGVLRQMLDDVQQELTLIAKAGVQIEAGSTAELERRNATCLLLGAKLRLERVNGEVCAKYAQSAGDRQRAAVLGRPRLELPGIGARSAPKASAAKRPRGRKTGKRKRCALVSRGFPCTAAARAETPAWSC